MKRFALRMSDLSRKRISASHFHIAIEIAMVRGRIFLFEIRWIGRVFLQRKKKGAKGRLNRSNWNVDPVLYEWRLKRNTLAQCEGLLKNNFNIWENLAMPVYLYAFHQRLKTVPHVEIDWHEKKKYQKTLILFISAFSKLAKEANISYTTKN